MATTHDPVTAALVAKMLDGVKLHDETLPLAAKSCRILDTHQLEIVLEQGKYHQVKRMLVAAGHHCIALRRTQIGGLKLDMLGLTEGGWCYLDETQLVRLTEGLV
jgi:16S rRNA pseudouridine516 synthase